MDILADAAAKRGWGSDFTPPPGPGARVDMKRFGDRESSRKRKGREMLQPGKKKSRVEVVGMLARVSPFSSYFELLVVCTYIFKSERVLLYTLHLTSCCITKC